MSDKMLTTAPTPPTHHTVGHDEVFRFPDGIEITCYAPLRDPVGRVWTDIRLHRGRDTFGRGQINLLDSRTRDALAESCRAVDGVVSWKPRLLCVADTLADFLKHAGAGHDIWTQGQTAADFIAQEEADVLADARDLLVPGCITIVAAPRASCKTMVAHALGLSLAHGGIFRGERLPQRRVALIDRDNAPALIRKRLRWLGGAHVTGLTVFTRDKAPPLTDAAAWAAFPVDQFDVVIVDSIGAATEGVSEKEGKLTQLYLATLKDLALRGPAILGLDNTNKAAQNYRGRGEKGDAVDILYEARNITGWTPAHGGDWWEDLPDFGEHTWQQRASRRTGQQVLRIAFIPSKFRLGIDPAPFCLEIDTRQEPWTLTDCTADLATAGERAAQEHTRQAQAKLDQARQVLVQALHARQTTTPLLKMEAEALLQAQGLTRTVARTLLMQGGNRDVYPGGWWVLRPIPEHPTGRAIGVYLAGGEYDGKRSDGNSSTPKQASEALGPSADGSTPSGDSSVAIEPALFLEENDDDLSPEPGYSTAEGDVHHSEHLRGSADVGGPSAEHTPSSGRCLPGRTHTWLRTDDGRLCSGCNLVERR